jgi:molybdopterin-guanine dinucleotide biosynthesis protein A
VNAYILVGGRSKRMGASKADLFLDRVAAAARPVFDEVLAVHRPDGEPLPIRTIFEEPHALDGPLFGIATALRDARDRCFVIGVDYPLLTSELLLELSGAFARSSRPMLVPEWNGQPQTLCAGYDAMLLPLIEERIAAGRLDLRGLLTAAAGEMIGEPVLRSRFAGEPLMNVNTPEELEEAVRRYGSQGFLASR